MTISHLRDATMKRSLHSWQGRRSGLEEFISRSERRYIVVPAGIGWLWSSHADVEGGSRPATDHIQKPQLVARIFRQHSAWSRTEKPGGGERSTDIVKHRDGFRHEYLIQAFRQTQRSCEIPSVHHHVTHSQASDLPTGDEPHSVLIHPFQHTRLAKS